MRISTRVPRTALAGGMALLLVAPVLAGPQADPEQSLRAHVTVLAGDELAGRLTGSPGAERAADYLVEQLVAIGAQPLPGQESMRLPFDFTAGVRDGGSAIELGGENWSSELHVQALSFSEEGSVTAPLVFAGYGLAVPESQGYPYDSYVGLDVTDKAVVVLRYFPEDVDNDARAVLSRYSGLRYKAMQARERGAAALIVVTGPRSPNGGEVVPMSFDTAVAGSGIPAVSASGTVADALMAAAGRSLEEVQAELDTGNPHVAGFEIPGEVRVEAKVSRERRTGHNVMGFLPALNPSVQPLPTKPWVMLGAHYDHLGHGRNGNSLARSGEAGQIHNGADDNASGVAAVLEAGRMLAGMQRDRGIVLAFWSGEELGLLGSTDFARNGALPADSIAAYLNFDMVGRSRDNKVVVQAVGTAEVWPGLLERANVPVGLDIQTQDDPYVPTDSAAFNQVEVPTLAFFTGSHEDYHRPSDDPDRLNYEDLGRIARLGALVAHRVANLSEPPLFVTVAQNAPSGGDRDSVRAFTGTIPDYAAEVEGLLLGGVIEGGPAEEAGLRAGDVIVAFADQEITNIYDYTFALDAVKVGVPVNVVYMRDGERHETTLTPRARR